jgi:hypothetical protein
MFDDEASAANGAEQAKIPDSQASPHGLVQEQKTAEGKQESANEKHNPDNTPKPISPVRMWRWLVNWWTDPYRSRGNFPEHMTVMVSVVIAIIAFLQYGVYRQQKKIMEGSGQQTEQLIDAANIQAYAAQKIADASKRNATAAESFSGTATNAVNEFKKAANESTAAAQRQAKAAEKSVTEAATAAQNALNTTLYIAQLDQRPWIGFRQDIIVKFEQDQPFQAVVYLQNTGHMPAFFAKDFFTTFPQIGGFDNPCNIPEGGFGPNPPGWENYGAVAPGSIIRLTTTPSTEIGHLHDAIMNHQQFLYICGKIVYRLENYPLGTLKAIPLSSTTFCLEYDTVIKDFRQCSEGNDMN